jgi:hypothetical protein
MSNTRELPWQACTRPESLRMTRHIPNASLTGSNVVKVVFGTSRTAPQSHKTTDRRSTVLDQVLRKAELLDW